MTFCLGINVEQGLVGIADTRVLTGNECPVSYTHLDVYKRQVWPSPIL